MTTIFCEYINQRGNTVICLVNEWNDCVVAIDIDNMEKAYLSSFPIDDILYDIAFGEDITFDISYIDDLMEYLKREENKDLLRYIKSSKINIYNNKGVDIIEFLEVELWS